MTKELIIVGGGLAGSEAAWQAASRGVHVRLFEMRPHLETGAHQTSYLGELVCSNSLGSTMPDRASGLLKEEMRRMGSLLLKIAEEHSLPAGSALAVDRDGFPQAITQALEEHPNIEIIREEITDIPSGPAIIASGPLTSTKLSNSIMEVAGKKHLYFFDAISPIISLESINHEIAFRASRYDRGEEQDGDYINCPMTKEEYTTFTEALREAERIELHSFEKVIEEEGVNGGMHKYFEGCLPVEVIASRSVDALAFGPMRPVGITDPRTGRWPFAVVQLRQDNLSGTMYNMVGFQTNLKFMEQKRVLRMIPGLENAEFLRYGQMHRNTFIFSPELLRPTLQFHDRDDLFFSGQITGIEGYAGNIASGLLAGVNASRFLNGEPLLELPRETMLGALCHYITHADAKDFQPMKANFGIVPPLTDGVRRGKRQRSAAYADRAIHNLEGFLDENSF